MKYYNKSLNAENKNPILLRKLNLFHNTYLHTTVAFFSQLFKLLNIESVFDISSFFLLHHNISSSSPTTPTIWKFFCNILLPDRLYHTYIFVIYLLYFVSFFLQVMSSFEVPIGNPSIELIMQELKERQEENARLKEEIEMIKFVWQTLASEVSHMFDSLVEEKIRYDRLEEQVNDLTELHQNEMENLKQAVKDLENMEEKVQYKNEENIKDLNEMVESCQTKIFRMEHQQAQQQQQFLTLEGLENSNARMLFVKLINILLTVLQVQFYSQYCDASFYTSSSSCFVEYLLKANMETIRLQK
ncbi:Transmembrane and coiled-coil domains protein 1 [Armadillidium vulgare]|nr:Transmembrane and coiled-coil domains protein 1 [Armadillidium vulgare]